MTLLEGGDIASARLFFRRAADAGLAEAAMALGGTFDPNEFGRIKAVGLKADPAEARIWYERARVLGASDAAAQRLQRLGGR
jgi:TPR repeat protein